MKNILTTKFKLWIIIALALVVVGMTLLGIFGFNQTVYYDNAYELEVKVEKNLGEADAVMEAEIESYFKAEGIKYATYAYQKVDGGESLIYRFHKSSPLFSDSAKLEKVKLDLETKIETAFNTHGQELTGLQIEVSARSVVNYKNQNVFNFVLAGAIALVILFVYVLIMEKIVGGLTVLCNAVISGILSIALLAITRIPAMPYMLATIVASIILSSLISVVIINKCRELNKNVANEKTSVADIAKEATKSSLIRIIFIAAALLVASLLLIILGTGMIKLIGLHVIVAGVASLFTAYGFTEIFYNLFKKKRK